MTEIMTELTSIKVMLAIIWLFVAVMYVVTYCKLNNLKDKINQLRKFIIPKCKYKKRHIVYCPHCDGHNTDCIIYKSNKEGDDEIG